MGCLIHVTGGTRCQDACKCLWPSLLYFCFTEMPVADALCLSVQADLLVIKVSLATDIGEIDKVGTVFKDCVRYELEKLIQSVQRLVGYVEIFSKEKDRSADEYGRRRH